MWQWVKCQIQVGADHTSPAGPSGTGGVTKYSNTPSSGSDSVTDMFSTQSIDQEFNIRLTNRNHTIEIYTMVKNAQL